MLVLYTVNTARLYITSVHCQVGTMCKCLQSILLERTVESANVQCIVLFMECEAELYYYIDR